MGIPTVKLVADVTPEIKEKLRRIAQRQGISIKDLIVQLAKELPENEQKGIPLQKDERAASLKEKKSRKNPSK